MTAPARQPMAPLTLDRMWRGSGITFVVAYLIYGSQSKIGASAETFVSFYDGDRTRTLIASALLGFSVLNVLWFAADLASWWGQRVGGPVAGP
jgi:hypothetical protein